MSRGLGKIQRKILSILKEDEWFPVAGILVDIASEGQNPKRNPTYSKAQTIWRAIRRLEKLGYVKTAKIINIVDYSSLSQEERRDIDFRFKYVRLTDKRLVLVDTNQY